MAARHGVENTLGRYAATFAAGAIEDTGLCFIADAEVWFPDRRAVGRLDIVRELARLRDVFRNAGETPHLIISSVIIEPTATGVSAISTYASFTKFGDGSLTARSGGQYLDTFIEVGTRWLIATRRVAI